MKELFIEQEKARYRLRLQHHIERVNLFSLLDLYVCLPHDHHHQICVLQPHFSYHHYHLQDQQARKTLTVEMRVRSQFY